MIFLQVNTNEIPNKKFIRFILVIEKFLNQKNIFFPYLIERKIKEALKKIKGRFYCFI